MPESIDNLTKFAIVASLDAGKAIMKIYSTSDFEITVKSNFTPLTIADREAHTVIDDFLKQTEYPVLSEEGKTIDYEVRKHWTKYWLVDPLDGTREFIKKNGEFTVNIALIEDTKPVIGIIYAPVLDKLYFAADCLGSFLINDVSNLKIEDYDIIDLIDKAKKLNCNLPVQSREIINVIASRSHINWKTQRYISRIKQQYNKCNILSTGSSLKFCLVAEGKADVYPRFSPTMEWDTAAGHCIVNCAGGSVLRIDDNAAVVYNKKDLKNPYFIVSKNAPN